MKNEHGVVQDPKCLEIKGQNITYQNPIVETFNHYFANVGTLLVQQMPKRKKQLINFMKEFSTDVLFQFHEIDQSDINNTT